MDTPDGAWSEAELAAFLDAARMPLRLGCHHSGGGLWMLSLWYEYRDEQFLCATGEQSDVVTFLDENPSVCFEVSTNTPPYMGVRGNGTVTLEPDTDKELLRSLLSRYFGGTESSLAAALLEDPRAEIAISVEPERLYTWDFSGRMEETLAESAPAATPDPSSPQK